MKTRTNVNGETLYHVETCGCLDHKTRTEVFIFLERGGWNIPESEEDEVIAKVAEYGLFEDINDNLYYSATNMECGFDRFDNDNDYNQGEFIYITA